VPFIREEEQLDRNATFSDRRNHLLRLFSRAVGVIRTVDHERRCPDSIDLADRRESIDEVAIRLRIAELVHHSRRDPALGVGEPRAEVDDPVLAHRGREAVGELGDRGHGHVAPVRPTKDADPLRIG
jgi:hypothetical protein